MHLLTRVAEPLLDLILPRTCAGCGREGGYLCDECESTIPRLGPPQCSVCSAPSRSSLCAWCQSANQPFNGITAPYRWTGVVQELVYSLKYRNVRASAPRLAELMSAHLADRSISRRHGRARSPAPQPGAGTRLQPVGASRPGNLEVDRHTYRKQRVGPNPKHPTTGLDVDAGRET